MPSCGHKCHGFWFREDEFSQSSGRNCAVVGANMRPSLIVGYLPSLVDFVSLQASQDAGSFFGTQIRFAILHRIFSINPQLNQIARFDQRIWRINHIFKSVHPSQTKFFSRIGRYFFYAISKPALITTFDTAKYSTNTKSVHAQFHSAC